MVARDTAHAIGRCDHRNAQRLRQARDLRTSLRQRGAMANKEHRLLRLFEQCQALREIHIATARTVHTVPHRGSGQLYIRLFLIDVVRDVQVNGTGAATDHGVHGLAQRQGEHVNARRLKRAFDHGPQNLSEVSLVVMVELLERGPVVL